MDREFWERLKNGEEAAFSEVYRLHADALYSYGMKITNDYQVVRECIQSVFIYLFDKRGSMEMPQNLGGYLMTVMKHLLYKANRYESLFLSIDSETVDKRSVFNLSIDWEDTMEHNDLKENQLEALQTALDSLSPQQREVLYLRYYKNLSVEDTAAVIGVSQQTVKNAACTAIGRLRKNELLLKASLLAFLYLLFTI